MEDNFKEEMGEQEVVNLMNEGSIKLEELSKSIRKAEGKTRENTFYVTDYDECMRKTYYNYVYANEIHFEPRVLRILQNGTYAHERLQKGISLVDSNAEMEKGMTFDVETGGTVFQVRGRIDVVVRGNIPLELKTINTRTVKKPLLPHIAQVRIYMDNLGSDYGFLVYESKQTNEIFVFKVEQELSFVNYYKLYFKLVLAHILTHKIPPRMDNVNPNKYPCKFCSHRKRCWGEIQEDGSVFKSPIPPSDALSDDLEGIKVV